MCDCAECRFEEFLAPVDALSPERIYRLYGRCVNCGDTRYLDHHQKERCPVCNPEPPPIPEQVFVAGTGRNGLRVYYPEWQYLSTAGTAVPYYRLPYTPTSARKEH